MYTHQRKYAPAEALFAEAAQRDTPNHWLWVNWGELLSMQGKTNLAVGKYYEAIKRPRTKETYDRAKLEGYQRYIELQAQRKKFDAVAAAYAKFTAEFGPGHCFNASYARFMLERGLEPTQAIEHARRTVDLGCADPRARDVLGVAYYVAWSQGGAADREESLNQARVFLPPGPRAIYLLASSDPTASAARALVKRGESIDLKDNAGFTALAYALEDRNLAVSKRLLRLGARPDMLVGPNDLPVALIPVLARDLDAVRFLRSSGFDYAHLKYRGISAADYARQTGDRALMEAIGASTGAT